MFQRLPAHLHPRCRAFTLVEICIASVILLLGATMSMSAFLYASRITKAQRTTLGFISQTNEVERILKEYANSASQFISNNGNTLTIVQPNGVQGQMNFVNPDGDLTTLNDNALNWDPNITVSGDSRVIARNLYPIDANTPIFTLVAASTDAVPGGFVLRVRFRMGDHASVTAKDQGYTGIGYQGYIYDSIFTPRNTSAT
jgi:type II secretory pathway pseudopilin PulG